MNLRSVSARGLKGFSTFPDQTCALDFDALPDGVYAIVGPNGAGKTTFLELVIAALYERFPSRPGGLISAADAKDAAIDVSFDLDGRGRYRARVNVDAVQGRTDAVLELTTPDGLTRKLNDGKISTFRTAVATELPSVDMLLASAFAAQSRAGSFSELGGKDRRDLFAELLGLQRYEGFADVAKVAAATVAGRLAGAREVLSRLKADTTDGHADAISEIGNALQADLTTAEHAKLAAAGAVVTCGKRVDDARAADTRHAGARQAVAVLERQRADQVQQRDALQRAVDAVAGEAERALEQLRVATAQAVAVHAGVMEKIPSTTARKTALTQDLAAIDRGLTTEIEARDQKIQNNRDLLARANDIRKAGVDHAAAAAAVAEASGRVDGHDAQARELERAVGQARGVLQAILNHGNPDSLLTGARQTAALIATVPFGEKCATAGCGFVAAAVSARDSIPKLERQVADVGRQRGIVDDLQRQLDEARTARDAAAADRDAAAQRVAGLAKDAAQIPTLDAAVDRVAELEAEQTRLRAGAALTRASRQGQYDSAIADDERARQDHRTAIDSLRAEWEQHKAAHATTWAAKAVEAQDRLTAAADALADTDAARASVAETAPAHAALISAEVDLQGARTAYEHAIVRLTSVEHNVEAFEARRLRFGAMVRERDQLSAEVRVLEDEQQAWLTHVRIFGREGLPTLEIDAAGPGVSVLANDLLESCFGGRFQIELMTQAAKADGKGVKEVFQIRVTDADRGTDTDLAALSGGERVIVDEALRSAIALYINQRNDRPIRTCWRDETVGALDADNAVRYPLMLRRIRERGGFRKVLYVSHNAEASALADAQIRIQNGTIAVLYPPFTTEAA